MKIFVTRKIAGSAMERLQASGHEVEISLFDRPLTEEELVGKVAGADGLLSLLTDRIDGELMDVAGPSLKVVANYAVGYDNINIEAATQRGIVVANTPSDEVNEAVAEHSWALMLSLSRRIVEADEATRRGSFRGWEPNIFVGTSLIGKTLGIIGLGGIGSMVARRSKGYNMRVLYYKREPDKQAEEQLGVEYADLDRLYSDSDIVSLHVPLTDETRHLINKDSLSKMKKGAFLINTARGPIVNEAELVEAIRSGHLGGAGLDVFENEPNINPELVGMENVILTPHIASATREARDKMGNMAVDALLDCLEGKKPDKIVNADVWEKRRT